jgi:hypothetical protein
MMLFELQTTFKEANMTDFDFVKERVQSIKQEYSHGGVYVVTLKPEFEFLSETAKHKMSFSHKQDALSAIFHARKVVA